MQTDREEALADLGRATAAVVNAALEETPENVKTVLGELLLKGAEVLVTVNLTSGNVTGLLNVGTASAKLFEVVLGRETSN